MLDNFNSWFATSPLASALRTLLAIFIYEAVTEFAKLGHFDFSNWENWLIGALAVAIPPFLRWLNPADKAF